MAKMRYMVDRRAVIKGGAVTGYEPIGVWVHQLPNIFEPYYLESIDPYDQDGWVIQNSMIERGVNPYPVDLLEHHRDSMSAYAGARGPIVETEEFANVEACGAAILRRIRDGRIT